jgi:hypothetical protein
VRRIQPESEEVGSKVSLLVEGEDAWLKEGMLVSRELQEIILYIMVARHEAMSRLILVFCVFHGAAVKARCDSY